MSTIRENELAKAEALLQREKRLRFYRFFVEIVTMVALATFTLYFVFSTVSYNNNNTKTKALENKMVLNGDTSHFLRQLIFYF